MQRQRTDSQTWLPSSCWLLPQTHFIEQNAAWTNAFQERVIDIGTWFNFMFQIQTFIASVRERMCTLAAKKRRCTLGEANRREVISRIQRVSLKQLLLKVSHSLQTETKSDGPWNVWTVWSVNISATSGETGHWVLRCLEQSGWYIEAWRETGPSVAHIKHRVKE